MNTTNEFLAMIVYVDVDDVLNSVTCEDDIGQVKSFFNSIFTIKYLGYAKYFLGVEISRNVEGTFLCQRKYIQDTINDTQLATTTSLDSPMQKGHKF